MQRILGFTVFIGLCLSQISFGKSLGSGKMDDIIAEQLKRNKSKPRKILDNCIDFSGIWSGQCVQRNNEAHTKPSKIAIIQSKCKSLTIDNLPINASGFSSVQSAPAEFDLDNLLVTLTSQGAWNDSQTQFIRNDYLSVSPLGLSALSSETLSLDGDQLVIRDGETSLVLDADGHPSAFRVTPEDCRYSRQQ